MDFGNSASAVTFLFTDVEGSTRLWEQKPETMPRALARHDAMIRRAVEDNHGIVVKMTGDGVYAAFEDPLNAVVAALQLQNALADLEAANGIGLRIRCGVHAGTVERRDNDFFGSAVNRAARIMDAAHGGQVLLSQVVAELVRDRLPAPVSLIDLGSHRLRDLSRPELIYQLAHPHLRHQFPTLRTLDATPNNLPVHATSFVGRESEQTAILALLSRHRMVTLLGPSGVGKTRLSLQVGAVLLSRFPDGVWFVDLAPLVESQLVAEATASIFGLSPPPTGAAAAVANFLREKKALIILDNCEHLIAACAELAVAIQRTCPEIHLLTSSRERLMVAGEHLFPVAVLATPDSIQRLTASTALNCGAVRLFVDRADAATGGFILTDDTAPIVAEICSRLDGIALAIELAAPRLRMLKPQQLLERLNDRFSLLTGGARTALPRQQTLRAAIDWSFDLLSGSEQALLRRLSVFAGGWTMDAASEVAAGTLVQKGSVFDLLTSLADKSLVTVDLTRSVPRYRLLESTREYATEKLAEAGENGWLHRHAEWLLGLFERAEEEWQDLATEPWLQLYEPELENLRAALEWSFGPSGDPLLGAALFAFTGPLWIEVSLQAEFRRWLQLAVSNASEALSPGVAGRIWLSHSHAGSPGDPAYIESATRAIDLARRAKEPGLLGRALTHASYLVRSHDAAAADSYLAEAERALRPLGRTKWLASLLNVKGGRCFLLGEVIESRASYAEAIAISQDVGHWLGYAAPTFNLIDDGFNAGQVESAIVDAGELVEECRKRQRLGFLGLALFYYGDYLLAADRYNEAHQIGLEGIRLNRSLGRSAPVNACIETVALAIALHGGFERAARLAGYVGAFYGKVRFVRGATQQRTWDRLTSRLRANLAPEVLEHLMAEGAIWGEDAAISRAIAD